MHVCFTLAGYKCLDGKESLVRNTSPSYSCQEKILHNSKAKWHVTEKKVQEKCDKDDACTGYDYYVNNKNEAFGHLCKQDTYPFPGSNKLGGFKLCQKISGKCTLS